MAHKLFCNANKSVSEASTLTHRGCDAFGTKITKNHRFSSLGLNLTFVGLLLGASLRLCMEGTCNEPYESGFQFVMLSFMQKKHLSNFLGRRRCWWSPSGRSEQPAERRPAGPCVRRLGAEGIMPVAERRLPRWCLHVAAPYWSVKK
jgi:hypothetical protein